MEFRDLGPLTVEFDGAPARLSGVRLVTVLATLLVHPDEPVSEDRLIDAVWGDRWPARAGAALDNLVWRLRQVLEPDRTRRDGWQVLRTEGTGYRLVARDDDVDSRAFVRDAGDAGAALRSGAPDRALAFADRALDRWRGPAYDGLPDAPWLAPVRTQLDDARVDTTELRVQALLDLGRPEQAVSAAQPAVELHPFRERLWAQLALGLYRAGRQAAALETFSRARRVLNEELGVSPGPELAALQAAMLDQDPRLLGPVTAATPAAVCTLPTTRGRLHGRGGDLSTVGALLHAARLTTITGPMGVGKTSLALAVARDVAPRFPGGVWFVDLTGATRGSDVTTLVAAALELRDDGPDLSGSVVRHLADRNALLLLDNCEQVIDAVAELTDQILDQGGSTVLATSREPLDLEREREHRLAPLSSPGHSTTVEQPAVQLFLAAAGMDGEVPSATELQQIGEICAAVGGLPLGIELAARRARVFDLDEVASSVADDPGGLRRARRESRAGRSLYDEIDTSVALCDPYEQLLHRRLSVLAGPFTLAAARATAAAPPLPPGLVMDGLAGLTRRSLLLAEPREIRRSTRFRQLVPIRQHAAQSLAATGDTTAVERRNAWVTELAMGIPQRGGPGQLEWYDRLEDDLTTVSAAVEDLLAGDDGPTAVRVVIALSGWAYDRNRLPLARRWLSTAAGRTDLDDISRTTAEAGLGVVLEIADETASAHQLFDRCLPVLAVADDPAAVGVLVDIASAAWVGDDYAFGAEIGALALRRASALEQPYERLIAESVLAAAQLFTGPPHEALAAAEEILSRPGTADNGRAMLLLCATAGVAALFAGNPDAGLRWTAESLRIAQYLGVRNMGETLEQRGNHFAAARRPEEALRCFGAAAAQYDQVGIDWPRHDGTATTVDLLRDVVPAAAFDQAWATGARLIAAGNGVRLTDWI